jgi:protein-tyrosine-phosphatase
MPAIVGQLDQLVVLVVCTGNAARSVMAGYMLERLAARRGVPLEVVTAGTHALDGQPMSTRTFAALGTIPALAGVAASAHRSHQLASCDVAAADLVVAMEAGHVRFVRRHHPAAAARTGTIRRLAAELGPGPTPLVGLTERLDALALAEVALSEGDDVADPAGKDDACYAACAAELWVLCGELVARL